MIKSELLDPRTMLLQLENSLPTDIRENDVLENVTWTPEVEIRGCTVRHIPTRGFLITTRRPVLVEDNDFHATQMPGILIENDASGWFESGCVRDMLIRNNRFHDCGEPAIHINPRNAISNPLRPPEHPHREQHLPPARQFRHRREKHHRLAHHRQSDSRRTTHS